MASDTICSQALSIAPTYICPTATGGALVGLRCCWAQGAEQAIESLERQFAAELEAELEATVARELSGLAAWARGLLAGGPGGGSR